MCVLFSCAAWQGLPIHVCPAGLDAGGGRKPPPRAKPLTSTPCQEEFCTLYQYWLSFGRDEDKEERKCFSGFRQLGVDSDSSRKK